MKGEALAALRSISESLEITTRQINCSYHMKKKFKYISENHQEEISMSKCIDDKIQFGTKVIVSNLFFNLSVRRKSIKTELEINLIKDFIVKMSILHHHIEWLLVEEQDRRKKVICELPSESSVSNRFTSLHGITLRQQMEVSLFNIQ